MQFTLMVVVLVPGGVSGFISTWKSISIVFLSVV